MLNALIQKKKNNYYGNVSSNVFGINFDNFLLTLAHIDHISSKISECMFIFNIRTLFIMFSSISFECGSLIVL